jgi:hypothetical protein
MSMLLPGVLAAMVIAGSATSVTGLPEFQPAARPGLQLHTDVVGGDSAVVMPGGTMHIRVTLKVETASQFWLTAAPSGTDAGSNLAIAIRDARTGRLVYSGKLTRATVMAHGQVAPNRPIALWADISLTPGTTDAAESQPLQVIWTATATAAE